MRTILILGMLAATVAANAADLDHAKQLYAERHYKQAEAELREILSGDSDHAEANLYLGMSLLQLGRVKAAESALRKADEKIADSANAKLGLARIAIENKNLDAADSLIKEAAAIDATNPDVPFNRGLWKAGKRLYADAIKDLEEAIQRNPENAYAHYYVGLSYNAVRRPDKMLEHFEKFLKLAPDAPERDRVQSLLKTVR